MKIIALMYMLSGFVSICAGMPQLIKLVRTRRASDFHLPTWSMWLCCQIVTLVYAAMIHAGLIVAISVLWISFYAAMVILIIRYGQVDAVEPAIVPLEPAETPENI
jgi:hypothetical protein